MKNMVGQFFMSHKHQYDKDARNKMRILRSRIRAFEQTEARRILGPCTEEIWKQIRDPETGLFKLKSLLVEVGKKRYTLPPPIRKIPKNGPKKNIKLF